MRYQMWIIDPYNPNTQEAEEKVCKFKAILGYVVSQRLA